MRVLVVFVLAVLTTVAHSECYHVVGYRSQVELAQASAPEAQGFIPFWKKKRNKKAKTSNRMKKHNKRMGKGFKRKNDDSLRRD